jgi:ribosome-binding factor A
MESKRQEKINRLLQIELGEIIVQELKHLTKGALVTVTKVHITPDLSIAKIFLSLFATQDKEALLIDFKNHTSEIRGKLGHRVRHQLRIVPELHFFLDDSLDYIENIDRLLDT